MAGCCIVIHTYLLRKLLHCSVNEASTHALPSRRIRDTHIGQVCTQGPRPPSRQGSYKLFGGQRRTLQTATDASQHKTMAAIKARSHLVGIQCAHNEAGPWCPWTSRELPTAVQSVISLQQDAIRLLCVWYCRKQARHHDTLGHGHWLAVVTVCIATHVPSTGDRCPAPVPLQPSILYLP